jgi:hypothetical protein
MQDITAPLASSGTPEGAWEGSHARLPQGVVLLSMDALQLLHAEPAAAADAGSLRGTGAGCVGGRPARCASWHVVVERDLTEISVAHKERMRWQVAVVLDANLLQAQCRNSCLSATRFLAVGAGVCVT